jgi:hypothetical protein
MFRRVVLEQWHSTLAAFGFALVAAVVLVSFVRALAMKPDRADKLAHLPLEDEPSASKHSSHE